MTSENTQSLFPFGEEEDLLYKNKQLCLRVNDLFWKMGWSEELAAAARVSETDVTIYYWYDIPVNKEQQNSSLLKRTGKLRRMRLSVPVNGEKFLSWLHGKGLENVKDMLEKKRISAYNK